MYRTTLLQRLPPFKGVYELVTDRQSVNQIIKEVLRAHVAFFRDYDLIATEFFYTDPVKTLKALFSFLKHNVRYLEETEAKQTVTSPAGIISLGEGDCKHYATFIGGVLDGLKRRGVGIDWFYRFASYDPLSREPGHVFVVAEVNGNQYWIDPVLASFNQRLRPFSYIDKTINIPNMALYRVSGIDEDYAAAIEAAQADDGKLDPDLVRALQVLLYYGVLTPSGSVNDSLIEKLHSTLPKNQFDELINARLFVANAAIGGLFSNIWRGIKKVTLFPMRNAFLSLVAFNAFGYATKLKNAVWDLNNNFTEFKDRLKNIWQNKFGGDWTNLQNTILRGAKKKAVLGSIEEGKIGIAPAVVAAWAGAAAAVIAAVMPLVNSFLKSRQQSTGLPTMDFSSYPYGVCADGITPKASDGSCPTMPGEGGNIIDKTVTWVKENPVTAAGAGVGIWFLVRKFF